MDATKLSPQARQRYRQRKYTRTYQQRLESDPDRCEELVLVALREGPLNRRELYQRVRIRRDCLQPLLDRLVRTGRIQSEWYRAATGGFSGRNYRLGTLP